MRLGARIFGILSGALILYLALGFLLPGTWDAEAEATFPHPPDAVFPFLIGVDRWIQWNAMPESGSRIVGPTEGVGAGLDWDDPQYGRGQFRILAIQPTTRMEYEVLIEGGSLKIQGELQLESEGGATRVIWAERGDFGRNPLLGYAARGMGASQKEAMEASLARLLALLREGASGIDRSPDR